jgi:ATP-dependent DNA helicase RecG
MLNESQHIEFKSGFNEDVIETLVAFANTKGGKVLVGVNNDGEPVKNFTIGQESIQSWVNEIKTKTQPSIIPDAEVIGYKGGEIVEFAVQEFPIKPVSCRGKYFKRVKNSNHLLSASEVVNLHLQTINSSWDAYPDTIHTPDDISLEKIQASIETMKSNGLTINETPISFLLKYDLLREGKLTNAAYLLFKKADTFNTTIELGRFQDAITIKDTARTKTDIITQIEQTLDFVRKHINKRVIITGEARNTQKWQYPMEAIREIVINMIIHRDYRSASDSIVKVFDNKIEFYNPGRLPDGITVDDLLSNNYKSTPHNKLIADFCKDMRLIEKDGSGIGRIVRYFKEEGLPVPDFRNISDGFQVTAYSFDSDNSGDSEKVTEKVTENQQKILEKIIYNQYITADELSVIVGISVRKIKLNISKLKQKGILERIGSDKGGYWKVIYENRRLLRT